MFEQKDYVSFETAKMLKDKGFDEPVLTQYSKTGTIWTCSEPENFNDSKDCYSRPTLYEAQKWIWEKHKMFVSAAPQPPFTEPLEFFFWIDFPEETIDNYGSLVTVEHFSSFQQALDAGIQEVLKHI